jgi:hypothetical protein
MVTDFVAQSLWPQNSLNPVLQMARLAVSARFGAGRESANQFLTNKTT